MNKYIKIVALLSFTAIIPCSAMAAQQVPATADPGVVIQGIEEETRAPSRLDKAITVEDIKPGKGLSQEKLFTLVDITLDGSSVYTHEQVQQILGSYIGENTSFADLNVMAQTLTRKYREDGYILSRVLLPPQEIENGIVHFKALEGRLTEVEVVGDFQDDHNLIRDLAAKLEAEGPTNQEALERYLLLIDDLPGIKARSVMQASDTPGGGKLIVTIEQDKFEGSASIDNRGSSFLGQTRGTLVGAFNSLLGIHDRTTVRGIMTKDTEEMKFFDLSHEEQVGTEGLRLKGRYALTSTNPGWTLKPIDVEGDSRLLDLEAMYPVIRSRQYNLNLIGGFTALHSRSDILGVKVSADRVRYFRAGGHFDFTDSFAGVTQFDLEVAQGVDWFNATKDGTGRTRSNGKQEFFRTNLTATRLQDLPGGFSLQLAGAAQHAPDALLASEEFSLGGSQFGRAYDSGEITGDRGIAGSFELRYGGPVPHDFIKAYQFYGFYDVGRVWNVDPVVAESKNESLASAGLGVRFNLNYDVSGYLEFDTPLTRDVSAEGDDDSRVFFSLLKRF